MVRCVRSFSFALLVVLLSSAVSGQQPKSKRELYIAPLLPAELAWKVSLPALPAAAAAMDVDSAYVPIEASVDDNGETIPAQLVALARETGARRWVSPLASRQPPVLTHGAVLVATATGIEAVDPHKGALRWSVALDKPVRAPMRAQGSLLLALLEGEELAAINLDRKEVAWRRSIGESGSVLMTADADAAYLVTATSRVMRVRLSDGSTEWQQQLEGELSEPTIDRDRLFVGSNAQHGTLWSLEARTGKEKWKVQGRVIGGAVVGTAVQGDRVYVVSRDNIVRALRRSSGNQEWDQPAARPMFPPRLFNGVVTVVGFAPTLATFRMDSGAAISTWDDRPPNLLLQGPPLIDPPSPFRVATVLVFRDGQVMGLKPTGMLFKESPLAPLTTLPGRAIPRER